jgi:hypothetical protein
MYLDDLNVVYFHAGKTAGTSIEYHLKEERLIMVLIEVRIVIGINHYQIVKKKIK